MNSCNTDIFFSNYYLLQSVFDLFRVVHAAVTYLDGVSVEDFS